IPNGSKAMFSISIIAIILGPVTGNRDQSDPNIVISLLSTSCSIFDRCSSSMFVVTSFSILLSRNPNAILCAIIPTSYHLIIDFY
ncbi:MAG: hypothetical protein ACC656_12940, partial [Candidatus Heimdallarchaeota archaeon]